MTASVETPGRLDSALARLLMQRSRLEEADRRRFGDIVARLSHELSEGHSCVTIDRETRDLVLASGLASECGGLPLVVEGPRLYLHRYWRYESRLAARVGALARQTPAAPDGLEALLDGYFPPQAGATDWQRRAARGSVLQRFSIITGGPGTGKTTTVVKVLGLLLDVLGARLDIALAAPTGKAAMRLQESIGRSKMALPCSDAVRARIPEQACTLHRLLGALPPSPWFRYNAEHPLPHDVVVVDEASMVDLALMTRLVDALKDNARLILLGDKDQLASVESGAVLADLTLALPHCTQELKRSWRFDDNIRALAEAVNRQASDESWRLLNASDTGNLDVLTSDPVAFIASRRRDYLRGMRAGADFRSAYDAFLRFQTLCSNRHGPRGVEQLNAAVRQTLQGEGLLAAEGAWYAGRPVMITQNDAAMQLYNGDIGLCMADPERNGRLMVFFERADGGIRTVVPSRLPPCETVFAMTVHKSQGSEFDEVLIVLPERGNPVLTKELLYTAITRARQRVWLAASEAIVSETLERRVRREGGLVDKVKAATLDDAPDAPDQT